MTNQAETTDTILSGRKIPKLQKIKAEVNELKGELNFGKARKLLEKVRDDYSQDIWIVQQLALCTYKDEALYPKHRFETALALLESINLRKADNKDAETLALGGAIYKRLWEFNGQLSNLFESLAFYRAAWERNQQQDMGYGGLSAAYLMDLLAARAESLDKKSGLKPKEAPELRKEAKEIRLNIHDFLLSQQNNPDLAKQYWFLVTIGEACYGLGKYSEAATWLDKARQVEAKEWELQTTFRQWVGIARQQGIEAPPESQNPDQWHEAWEALQHLLGDNTAEALGCYRGKVGLALSGGGFRASFFHLGVMARLAEVDALRSVEVISTVSGGSILGAQYYLEVQNLLQDSTKNLSKDDYLDLIQKLQNDFLQGVQANIRMRAFNNFFDNIRMLFSSSYTRSHKLGELYEEELYSRVADNKGHQPRHMPELLVRPAHGKFQGTDFKPNFHNWRRRSKVPLLLLNTTSLNSGHNWRFTASWMGEPPGLVDIDSNQRYRRLYYPQAPEHLKKYRVGYAAAASSCVPGLFEPLVIDQLYESRSVKLVDGGVHDNQGVQGLLNEACTLILCSDASGQMGDEKNPVDDPGGVLLRTVSVLQDRVREAEYLDLRNRLDSFALEGVCFIHMQKDLVGRSLDWIDCQDLKPAIADTELTSYGIAKDLQAKIASLRTDLDSFTEVEAYALMASGYMMTEQQLKVLDRQHKKDGKSDNWGGFEIDAPQQRSWEFLKLKDLLAEKPSDQASDKRKDLALQLQVGSNLFFKAWYLSPWLKYTGYAVAGLILLVLSKLIMLQWQNTFISISVGGAVFVLLGVIAGLFLPALKWLNPKKETRSLAIKFSIALTGFCLAKLHLYVFDPLFLARGKLARLLNLGSQ